MDNTRPPQLFTRFFEWYCKEPLQECILGDLEEQFYDDLDNKGLHHARWRFIWTVIRFFRPGIVRNFTESQKLNQYGMFKNYYKVSVRNILRNKTFSLLNVAGLSIGIASCLLILLYVHHEMSYDTYNEHYSRTYRVLQNFGERPETAEEGALPISAYQVWGNAPVADALDAYYPQIEKICRFTSPTNWLVEYRDSKFMEKDIAFADASITEVFSWKWHAGDPKTALVRPATIVLSVEMAQKYFGDEDPIGKTLRMDDSEQYEVTGVYEIPPNAHFSNDAYISMVTFKGYRPQIFEMWDYVDFYTYFIINDQSSIESMQAALPDFLDQQEGVFERYDLRFEPLASAYLDSEAGRQPGEVGNRSNIYLFLSVALFILVIAIINFVNLATGRSVERAKEAAIRKTIGAYRSSLIAQFLVEAILLTFIAGVLALLMVWYGHTYLEFLIGKQLPIYWLFSAQNLLIGLLAILVIGIMAGLYPAIVISGFTPVKVLKGSFKNSTRGVWLRKSLVVLQFSLSVILLVGTAIVYQQLSFLQSHDKGFDAEQVLVIDYGGDYKVKQNIKQIKQAFLKHSAVQTASASRATPGDFFPNAGTAIEGTDGEMIMHSPAIYEIDEDFIPTYDIKVIAGRNFSRNYPLDSATALLVNEATAHMYGFANAADIVGKKFNQWGREGKVVGVVADFNYKSLHSNVEPLALRYSNWWSTERLSVKLKSSDMHNTLDEMEAIWQEVVPAFPFNANFNEASFNRQYESDARFGQVFSVFSGLAVFIACLGLFGLTIYSTNQRAKEIGVRKVLGSSVKQIVMLLSYDFLKLFGLSLLISIPVSWLIMDRWLADFAYRVTIGWEIYALAAGLTLLIAFATMSFKTVQAALLNPAKVLKNE